MKFKRCDYIIITEFTHQQQLMINEKQHHAVAKIYKISILNKDVFKKKFNLANSCKNQQCQLIRVSEESHAPFIISEILKKYSDL